MYKEIREGIGEEVEAHWTDRAILRKMNQVQRVLWRDMAMLSGDWFLTSSDITPVASIITLPSDCGKVIYVENKATGARLPVKTVREKEIGEVAYFTKEGMEVSTPSYTEEVTVWYLKRLANMHFGTAGANSAASALHLDIKKAPEFKDDYYNDLDVEIWSSAALPKIETTITDYTGSTNIAVITGTATAGDFYGTVPQIPEEGHYLMVLDVLSKCLMKPGSSFDVEYVKLSLLTLREARTEWLEWIETRALKPSYITRRKEE